MEHTQKQKITELSEFDSSISLWQMIPSGSGTGLSLLRTIVDSVLNSTNKKVPSVLITGPEGKRTCARAYSRALASDKITEVDGSLLQLTNGLHLFYDSTPDETHIVINAENITPQGQLSLTQILREKKFTLYNYMRKQHIVHAVPSIVILTANELSKVPEPIITAIDFVVEIEKFSFEQLQLVVLQRLKYGSIEYQCEEVLEEIVMGGEGQLKQVIRYLKVCVAVMRADGRDILMLSDIERAARISGSKK